MSSHRHGRERHRAIKRALSLLIGVAIVASASVAWASPAPMCDEHAQSIAAPFPILPSHNGEARSAPCDDWRGGFELGRAPSPDRDHQVPASSIERALPVTVWGLPRDRGHSVRPAEAVRLDLRAAHTGRIERPPRSRAS